MSTYKLLDWRGKLPGQPWSNIGSGPHTPGRKVIHYSGDDAQIYRDMRSGKLSLFDLIKWETEYQMEPGRYVAGFAVNGMMYHEVIWEDIVAIVRNADAWLYHCADGMVGPTWNKTARSIHIPLTAGVRASERTKRTLAERCDDLDRESGAGRGGRKLTLGHQEISSTACPGTLMSDFVYPYRSGKLNPEPPEKSEKWDVKKYNFLAPKTEWAQERAEAAVRAVNDAAGRELAAWTDEPLKVVYASQAAYESEPVGKLVAVAVGQKSKELLSAQAEGVLGQHSRSESDIWDGRYTGEMWECMRAIAGREKLVGLASSWNEKYGGSQKGKGGPEKPEDETGPLSLAELTAIYTRLSKAEYEKRLPGLNEAMRLYDITGPYRMSAFLGNLAEESGQLYYTEEIASGAAYEGRQDLGNTQPGDGVRFKGRGYIQLTGRANYTAASKAFDVDFVSNPKLVSTPKYAALVSGWFWDSRDLNTFADKGNAGWPEVCRRINGQYPARGQAGRDTYYSKAWEVLKK